MRCKFVRHAVYTKRVYITSVFSTLQEPHSVTLLVPGTATRMIHVRCTEPQRIYELFKKYGLTCSNVWDSRTSLSATAPCTALCDHNMTTVNVNRIAENDALGQEPEVSNFYHNMKCIRIQAKRDALKHRPYNCHQPVLTEPARMRLSPTAYQLPCTTTIEWPNWEMSSSPTVGSYRLSSIQIQRSGLGIDMC